VKQPLFLVEGRDVSVFQTPDDLDRFVESPDLAEYRVFDSEGNEYFFKGVAERPAQKVGVIKVARGQLNRETSHVATDEFRGYLLGALSIDDAGEGAQASLSVLVALAVKKLGFDL